jgi:hypothetical protein
MFQYLLFSVYVGLISLWDVLRRKCFCHKLEIVKLDDWKIDHRMLQEVRSVRNINGKKYIKNVTWLIIVTDLPRNRYDLNYEHICINRLDMLDTVQYILGA